MHWGPPRAPPANGYVIEWCRVASADPFKDKDSMRWIKVPNGTTTQALIQGDHGGREGKLIAPATWLGNGGGGRRRVPSTHPAPKFMVEIQLQWTKLHWRKVGNRQNKYTGVDPATQSLSGKGTVKYFPWIPWSASAKMGRGVVQSLRCPFAPGPPTNRKKGNATLLKVSGQTDTVGSY